MAINARPTTCAVCDAPLPAQHGRGRPRAYCSVSCRTRAAQLARTERDAATYEALGVMADATGAAPLGRTAAEWLAASQERDRRLEQLREEATRR